MALEFVTFEKATEELGTTPEQLKKWISSGAIRAFSDGGTFKFRRQDLDAFKSRHQAAGAQTMAVPPAPAAAPAEEEIPELSLEEVELVEEETPPSQPEPSKPVPAAAPTMSTEELSLEDIEIPEAKEETQPALAEEMPQAEVLSLEGDLNILEESTGAEATQPIEIEGDAPAGAADSGTVSMEIPSDLPDQPDAFGLPAARAGGLDVRREGSPFWAALVAVTAALLVLAGVVMIGVVKDQPVGYLSGFSDFLVDKARIK